MCSFVTREKSFKIQKERFSELCMSFVSWWDKVSESVETRVRKWKWVDEQKIEIKTLQKNEPDIEDMGGKKLNIKKLEWWWE